MGQRLSALSDAVDLLVAEVESGGLDHLDAARLVAFLQDVEAVRNWLPLVDHRTLRDAAEDIADALGQGRLTRLLTVALQPSGRVTPEQVDTICRGLTKVDPAGWPTRPNHPGGPGPVRRRADARPLTPDRLPESDSRPGRPRRRLQLPLLRPPAPWYERHHIVAWIDGRRTDLDNLTLLCRYHHHHLAARGWTCRLDDDRLPLWTPPRHVDREPTPLRNARLAVPRPGPAGSEPGLTLTG